MSDKECLEAMRALGESAGRALDDLLAPLLRDGGLNVPPPTPRSRAERFDALMAPKSARDYGESLTGEEFEAESKARGMPLPGWWPL